MTVFTQSCDAEAILNDRPITKLSDDPMDLEALTPNHILLLKGKPSLSPGLFDVHDLYSGAKKYLVSHQLCKFSHLKR